MIYNANKQFGDTKKMEKESKSMEAKKIRFRLTSKDRQVSIFVDVAEGVQVPDHRKVFIAGDLMDDIILGKAMGVIVKDELESYGYIVARLTPKRS